MTYIETIEEYPLPFDPDSIIEMQEESLNGPYGLRDEDDIIESVDAFHDLYIEELVRTDEWSVFTNHWLGCSNWVYFWNHQSGHGFRARDNWETMCGLVEMMDAFTDEFDSSDFEPNRYPWELP